MNDMTPHLTTEADMQADLARLRATFASGKTRPLEWRRSQLKAILRMLKVEEDNIIAAIQADMRKNWVEAYTSEIAAIRKEAQFALKNLKKWTKKIKVGTPLLAAPGKSWLQPEPLGVALIMTAWNFPFHQSLTPAIAAIAAGNCVMIKPSELSENGTRLIAEMYLKYLDNDAVAIFQGGPAETGMLLEQKFDHILYTGGGTVGKIVMTAAAKHLTPVTLELGGKSPVIVDKSADIQVTARRIVWAKTQNAGQICINADTMLVHESIKDELVRAIIDHLKLAYGEDAQKSPDYARIINERHFDRIVGYLGNGGNIIHGGGSDRADKYIEPTLVEGLPEEHPLLTEEIFGPILPILTWSKKEEVVEYVTSRDKPLALYIFGTDKKFENYILDNTSAGNVAINDLMLFAVVPGLPFGGVGASGMGSYTGTQGFVTFSHYKPILKRGKRMDLDARYAPYNEKKKKMMRLAWK